MKDVYEKNPQMGDPGSLQPKLAETMNNIDRLRMEIHKNEAWLSEVEGKTGGRGDRRHSSDINHLVTQGRESPEGSYTDDANQEVRGPPSSTATTVSLMTNLKMTTPCLLLDTAKLSTLSTDIMKVLWQ